MKILVCSDRDWTINVDAKHFLGAAENWREQVEFMPGVVEGINLLNGVDKVSFFIISNQAGVALGGNRFNALTEERVREVNDFIIDKLGKNGARVDGCFFCPFVSENYVRDKEEAGITINKEYVRDKNQDRKPDIGMIQKAAKKVGVKIEDCLIYVIGDRDSDVKTGLNAGGKGVLVPSPKTKERGDIEKLKALPQDRIFVADDFLDAAKWVVEDIRLINKFNSFF
jgi:histidinol-phosphate phosphatase family protein